MALPIWGLYMKKNYANEDLGVSDKDFVKPRGMSIELDCDKLQEELEKENDIEDDIDDIGI